MSSIDTHFESLGIRVHLSDDVAIIDFDSPEYMNGLTVSNMPVLATLFTSLGDREDVKLIVLKGSERFFCTGGSMELLAEMNSSDQDRVIEILEMGQDIIRAMRTSKALIISYVEGLAAGAGLDIALASDRIFISETARVNWSFSKMNLLPDLGGLFFANSLIGRAKTLQLLLENKVLKSSDIEALGIGIQTSIDGAVPANWAKLFRKEIKVSKEVTGLAKQSLWSMEQDGYNAHVRENSLQIYRLLQTEEHRKMFERTRAMQRIRS